MFFIKRRLIIIVTTLFIMGCSIQQDTDFDVIVIGSGIGGLSAGAHLAANGLSVLVIEKNDRVGGCATSFRKGDFLFESSLHEMAGGGAGKNDRGVYKLLKISGVDRYVELYELPEFYRSVYPGIDITLPSNWDGFKSELIKNWPDEAEGVEKFHSLCRELYSDMMELKNLFRYGPVKRFFTKIAVPFRQPTFYKWKDKSAQDLLDECFTSEQIKAVAGQLWVYYGAPLEDLTALMFMSATEVYLSDGVWHVRGTAQALSNGYAERIRDAGGTVLLNTMATKIVLNGKRAVRVQTADGSSYSSRYIVANTDPYQLVHRLIGTEHLPRSYVKKLNSMKQANSLFGVYLGLNIDLKERGYDDTEIIYNRSLKSRELNDSMMSGNIGDGMVAATIYSNYDSIYAPAGKSNIVLAAYSDISHWTKDGESYQRLKEKKVDELILLASYVIPELADSKNILIKEGFTPVTIEQITLNRNGVAYGFYLSRDQWEKIPNSTPVKNIYIASNWTQTWHGMGSGQVNGWRAARLILDKEGIK